MPQSLARILVHLVFSTHCRRPLLLPPLRNRLHAYLTGVLRECDCVPLQVGGVADHVHLLFGLSRTGSLSSVVATLKTSSSRWMKEQDPALAQFRWQAGYGAFSVSQGAAAAVARYIRHQESHHLGRTYQDELRGMLHRSQIPFDERYLWD